MKWLCPLPTSEPGFSLFIQCGSVGSAVGHSPHAPGRKRGAAHDGVESSATAVGPRASVQELFASAVSFLASSVHDDAQQAVTPRSSRPTSADMRRRAAALSRRQPAAPPTASAAPSPPEGTATCPDDELHFLLVHVARSAEGGGGAARLWAPRHAITASALAPADMDAVTYCQLLDALLRPGDAEKSARLRVVLPPGAAAAALAVCRVELRVSLAGGEGGGDFVLAAVEHSPEETLPPLPTHAPSTRLGELLQLLSAHVKTCHDLRHVVDRQAAEIGQLRAAIARDAAARKARDADESLMPLCDILNAKKAKIRELTAALQRRERDQRSTRDGKQPPKAAVIVKQEPMEQDPASLNGGRQRLQDGTSADDDKEADSASQSTGDSQGPPAPVAQRGKRAREGEEGQAEQQPRPTQANDGGSIWVNRLFHS